MSDILDRSDILDMRLVDIKSFSEGLMKLASAILRKDVEAKSPDKVRQAEEVTQKFYERLDALGYHTAREAIPALEQGAIPIEYIDEVLAPGVPNLVPELVLAIRTGYISTGKANPQAVQAFDNGLDEQLARALGGLEETLTELTTPRKVYYKSYIAGMGTRQPQEHLFYSPDFNFAVIIHETCFTGQKFLRFLYDDQLSKVKEEYDNGALREVELPYGAVQTLFEQGKAFNELYSGLDKVVQQLMDVKGE